ncbi:MAG: hypothetical protein UT64_C0014G0006 [Candidatus Falkowbacteria bacterium GW2011_GWF2_39_8]|uniref:YibE/F family protein n=1 Tax=Candidatus Falkowbacteria bacterium GW2011_GWF2_39_8 TaxID=1618642 RepID=A0A0G0PYY2_9BACT|nr:MAG: hypothetical protein UT64_C0014G0006 [Candidatus Falkowbacteria bacterium GW2011_GWF2_39_8]
MKKIIISIAVFLLLFSPVKAQETDIGLEGLEAEIPQEIIDGAAGELNAEPSSNIETFKAKVIKILDEKEETLENNRKLKKQKLLVRGSVGKYAGKEIEIDMTDDQGSIVSNVYRVGDTVLVMQSFDAVGNGVFVVTDLVRTNIILWVFIAFVALLLAVGKFKGVRALLSLVLSFLVIVEYIVPQILNGADPVMVTVIGSFGILVAVVYVTEGFNKTSHIGAISIFISLLATIALSWFLVKIARLAGLSSEEAAFILDIGKQSMNLQGILLSGIIIGTLGALDDIVIAQVTVVEQLYAVNSRMPRKEVFRKAFRVGVAHISSMTNTLFLAYAGAGLPLIILYVSGKSSFGSWDAAMNNEMIATEIIRTLAGSIGIVLAVPISIFISVWVLKKSNQE